MSKGIVVNEPPPPPQILDVERVIEEVSRMRRAGL